MEKIKEKIKFNYLKNNIWFLLSGFSFYLMTFQNNKYFLFFSLLLMLIIFFTSIILNEINLKFKQSELIIKGFSIITALLLNYAIMTNFINSFNEIFKFKVNLSLLFIIAIFLAVMSLYFSIIFSNFIILELLNTLNELIIYKDLKSILKNINSNMLLIISYLVFLGFLNFSLDKNSIISLFISFFTILFVFSQFANVSKKIKYIPFKVKLYSFLSTLGICYFYFKKSNWQLIGSNHLLFQILLVIAALISCIVFFVLVSLLLNFVFDNITNLISSLSRLEIAIYLLIIVLLISFVGFTYLKSDVFYNNGDFIDYDIIYTSDSPSLVKGNVYLDLFHVENDIRQPLFAVFSAPIVGFGYILSMPFSHFNIAFTPMFMNFVQIPLMILMFIMLAKMLDLSSCERICFVLIFTVSYTCLLFSIMIEQYIISCFWLIFGLYLYSMKKKSDTITFCAFSGTLITSGVLLPFTSKVDSDFMKYISEMKKKVICFIILLLSFCRFDIFLNFINRSTFLSQFLGGKNFIERFCQYSSFISSLFIAPDTIIKTNFYYSSWQLSNNNITNINIFGIVILILCVVSFILNHKNYLIKISGFWVCFSFFVLCLLGWGSSENGMILYSLYFGWAFFVLLFQFLKWLSLNIKFRMFVPMMSIISIIILFIYNYQGISELLKFAFSNYPI